MKHDGCGVAAAVFFVTMNESAPTQGWAMIGRWTPGLEADVEET